MYYLYTTSPLHQTRVIHLPPDLFIYSPTLRLRRPSTKKSRFVGPKSLGCLTQTLMLAMHFPFFSQFFSRFMSVLAISFLRVDIQFARLGSRICGFYFSGGHWRFIRWQHYYFLILSLKYDTSFNISRKRSNT